MSRLFFSFTLLLLFTGCQSTTPDTAKDEPEATVTIPVASLERFADSLVRLDQYATEGIGKAARYFQEFVPADSSLADSAAVMLLHFCSRVLDTVNQKLWTDTADYFNLLYPGGPPATAKQKEFQQSLGRQHIILKGNGEGDAIAVLDYDWLAKLVQPKTSPAVDNYLFLIEKEETDPALQDASLSVEMKELADRLVTSENLLTQKLPAVFSENLRQKNKFYTDIFFIGTNNSPAFDDEQIFKLTTEFEKGYTYLLQAYPSSIAAQQLKEWMEAITAKDRKKIEERRSAVYQ